MSARLLGVALLVLGLLALAYGGFSYTQNTEKAHIGPVKIDVREHKYVNVPLWAGAAVAVVGGILLTRKA
jgi:TRAP-type C4-dicarboxylate transport system permease small subunit